MRAAHGSVGSSCRLGLGDHSAEAKLQDFVKAELHGAWLQRVIAYDLVSGRVPLLRASNLVSGRSVLCTEVLRHATELVSKHGPCNMHARIRGKRGGGHVGVYGNVSDVVICARRVLF